MREALSNLIDNALHYAGTGSQVTVQVGLSPMKADTAVLEVTDNGPGIPASDHARVFERFVRGTDSGEGCGLGLAIVREIVERNAGQVALIPAQPQGLCVRIELPLASATLPH